jgi:hypothetical protein
MEKKKITKTIRKIIEFLLNEEKKVSVKKVKNK